MPFLAASCLQVGLFVAHVQQRVGLVHSIPCRTADDFEALLEIETQGLWVLFIDVQLVGVQVFHGVAQQLFTQALAAMFRVDEQHFNLASRHPAKPVMR